MIIRIIVPQLLLIGIVRIEGLLVSILKGMYVLEYNLSPGNMQQKLFKKEDKFEATNESEEEVIELVVEEIKADMKLSECIDKLNDIAALLKEIALVMNKPVEIAEAPRVSNIFYNSKPVAIFKNSESKPCLKNFKFTHPPTSEDFVTIKKIAIEENLHTSEVSTFLSSCEESLILKEFFGPIPNFDKLLQDEFDWEMYDSVQAKISGTGEYLALKERALALREIAQREFKTRCRPTSFLFNMVHEINSRLDKRLFINWSSVLCFFVDILPDLNKVLRSGSPYKIYHLDFLEKLHVYEQPTLSDYHCFWKFFLSAYLNYLRDNPTHVRYEFLLDSYETNKDKSYYIRVRRVLLDGIESLPPAKDTRKLLYGW